MPLISGSITQSHIGGQDYLNSMSKAMVTAFLEEWKFAMPGQPEPEVNDQMLLLFVAISKGIIRHLEAQQSSFQVTVTTDNNVPHTATTDILTQVDL
jgi:hypothetical protein